MNVSPHQPFQLVYSLGLTDDIHQDAIVKKFNPKRTTPVEFFLKINDPLLTPAFRQKLENRGGCGILKLRNAGESVKAERNIYLGRNIPDYPVQPEATW